MDYNKVKVISQETIKPSTPTPPHLKTYRVSLLDQFSPSSYMPFIFFYAAAGVQNPADQLRESFAKALSIYYPLAGRFRDAATIDCNDEGALFVEARVNNSLSEFFKNPDIQGLSEFLPCKGNGLVKSPIPHVAVKVTVFECGGIVVGACLYHKVVDALSAAAFLNDWGKITRGESIVEPDFTAASTLFPPRDPLPDEFVRIFDNFFFQGTTSYMRRYTFDEGAVIAIRAKASTESLLKPSRLEALSAFVAERMAGAHSKLAEDQQSSFTTLMLTHPVNLRQRVEPPLPENTFGNVIWLAFGFYEIDPDSNGEIQLGDLAGVLREAFSGLDKESMAELDNDEAFAALNDLLESVYTNERIKIYRFTTAANMGLYEVDFGWGKPGWFGHMGDMVGYRSKQQFTFVEAASGRGMELWLAADEAEHAFLEKDAEFLKYAVPNPAISV